MEISKGLRVSRVSVGMRCSGCRGLLQKETLQEEGHSAQEEPEGWGARDEGGRSLMGHLGLSFHKHCHPKMPSQACYSLKKKKKTRCKKASLHHHSHFSSLQDEKKRILKQKSEKIKKAKTHQIPPCLPRGNLCEVWHPDNFG